MSSFSITRMSELSFPIIKLCLFRFPRNYFILWAPTTVHPPTPTAWPPGWARVDGTVCSASYLSVCHTLGDWISGTQKEGLYEDKGTWPMNSSSKGTQLLLDLRMGSVLISPGGLTYRPRKMHWIHLICRSPQLSSTAHGKAPVVSLEAVGPTRTCTGDLGPASEGGGYHVWLAQETATVTMGSKVSTECGLLLHHRQVKKLRGTIPGRRLCMCTTRAQGYRN